MQVEQLVSTRSGGLIQGPLLLTPRVFGDDRGFFFESWNQRAFVAALVEGGWSEADAKQVEFRQDNHSRSSRGVLRGLHYQLEPERQGKLVRCTVGAIFDVAVDLRRSSDTFGHWVAAELTAENHQQLCLGGTASRSHQKRPQVSLIYLFDLVLRSYFLCHRNLAVLLLQTVRLFGNYHS